MTYLNVNVSPLGWKFFYALLLILIAHNKHFRKRPKRGLDGVFRLPHYYGHLFRVCGYVMEWGGSNEAIIVSLLHDVLEDTDLPPRFLYPLGKSIRRKVSVLTQNALLPKPERKQEYCNRLVHLGDPDVFLVTICDKWDNWKSYKMEGYIPSDVLTYYSYFINSLSCVCQHELLSVLALEVTTLQTSRPELQDSYLTNEIGVINSVE